MVASEYRQYEGRTVRVLAIGERSAVWHHGILGVMGDWIRVGNHAIPTWSVLRLEVSN